MTIIKQKSKGMWNFRQPQNYTPVKRCSYGLMIKTTTKPAYSFLHCGVCKFLYCSPPHLPRYNSYPVAVIHMLPYLD